MTKEDLFKANEIDSLLTKINVIHLPQNISDVNLVRDDGVVNKWDGDVKVDSPTSFKIEGKNDDYNRYYIKIGDIDLTAKEGAEIINVVNNILSNRKSNLEKELKNL